MSVSVCGERGQHAIRACTHDDTVLADVDVGADLSCVDNTVLLDKDVVPDVQRKEGHSAEGGGRIHKKPAPLPRPHCQEVGEAHQQHPQQVLLSRRWRWRSKVSPGSPARPCPLTQGDAPCHWRESLQCSSRPTPRVEVLDKSKCSV